MPLTKKGKKIMKSMKDAVYSYDNSSDLKNRGTAWRSLYGDDNLPWPNNGDNKLGNITIYAKTGTAETGKDYRRELVNKKGDKYLSDIQMPSPVVNTTSTNFNL